MSAPVHCRLVGNLAAGSYRTESAPVLNWTCRQPRCDTDVWVEIVEAANEAKAAGTKKADAIIEARRANAGAKKMGGTSGDASADSGHASDGHADSRGSDLPPGLDDDLKKMSPEERKRAIKERVQARRNQKKKDNKEL